MSKVKRRFEYGTNEITIQRMAVFQKGVYYYYEVLITFKKPLENTVFIESTILDLVALKLGINLFEMKISERKSKEIGANGYELFFRTTRR